jgi:tetratricopeptide (TPR) repeat protein
VHWPDDAEVCADISGFMRSRLRRFDAAEEWATRAIQLNPRSERAHANLAWAYFVRSQYEKATDGFQAAIRLRPDAYWDYVGLARAEGSAGHVHEAIAAAERAVALRPDYITGLMVLSYWCLHSSDRHRAAIALERVMAIDSTRSGALNNLAVIYNQEGKHHKALETFVRAAHIDSTDWLISNNVAGLALNLGKMDRAREAALGAIERARGNLLGEASGYEMLGRVDKRAGREQDAASDYQEGLERIERAIGDRPHDAQTVKLAGYLCAETGDAKRAQAYATWLAETQAETASYLYDAASIMALTGERERALGYLEAAVDAGFDDAWEMSVNTDLDSLRDDPRFKKLVDRLK